MGYHPWRVDPQMRDITYRFDLGGRIGSMSMSPTRARRHARAGGAACVNNTDLPQNITASQRGVDEL